MKWYFALVLVVLLSALAGARAEGFDDQYVRIYNLILEGDSLSENDPASAMAKYVEAQKELQQIQRVSPDWNAKVVTFRLSYVAGKIAALAPRVPAAAEPQATNAPAANQAPPSQPPAPANWEEQLGSLREQARRLEADKQLLQAKLKEALALQPAAIEPAQLAKAEEQLRLLQKENDLLKVALQNAKEKPASASDTQAVQQTQQALAEANRQLAAETRRANALAEEKKRLQERLAKPAPASPPSPAQDLQRQLAQAKAEIAALQSDKEVLRLERIALSNRLQQMSNSPAPTTVKPSEETANRLKELERERDLLQRKLAEANQALAARKNHKAALARVQELETQLVAAHAKLDVLEARQVPYTEEEKALFRRPEPVLTQFEATTASRSAHKPSAQTAKLVAEARAYFGHGEYAKAEEAYQEVLHQDEKNAPALVNLAVIQLERNNLSGAETNLNRALAIAPEDAYTLSMLGNLRFRQGKYDQALEALSRSAKLDPNDAETQNYLGLVLAEKGLRGPAETAFRKAIQLQPNYAGAHYNLAVFYATQQSPSVELARWHYQKALAAGQPHNPEVEKILDEKK